MIHVVDYGLGNVQAIINTYKRIGIDSVPVRDARQLNKVGKIILPGVGSFDHALEQLAASGMRERLEDLVLNEKVPVLGICVGMQILAHSSEEGVQCGLGWVPGRVRSFASNPASESLPMPHMGWNNVVQTKNCPLFNDLEDDGRFYFLHSYYFDVFDPNHQVAQAEYGFKFDAIVNNGNVFGVQFHPEKSHHFGMTLLKNFAEL